MSLNGVQPPLGAVPETWDVTVRVRNNNVSAGRTYCFALLQNSTITADGETLSTDPNAPGFPYASIVVGSANDRRTGRYCVALESKNDGELCRVRVRGLVRAFVYNSANANIVVGTELILGNPVTSIATGLDAASTGITGGTTLRKIVGLAMEAYSSTPSDGTTMVVDFDGWSGLGSANST